MPKIFSKISITFFLTTRKWKFLQFLHMKENSFREILFLKLLMLHKLILHLKYCSIQNLEVNIGKITDLFTKSKLGISSRLKINFPKNVH